MPASIEVLAAAKRAADRVRNSILTGDRATTARIAHNGVTRDRVWLAATRSAEYAERILKAMAALAPMTDTNDPFAVEVPGAAQKKQFSFSTHGEVQAAIIDLLGKSGPVTRSQIIKALDISEISANRALAVLVTSDQIHHKRLGGSVDGVSKEAIYALRTQDIPEDIVPGFAHNATIVRRALEIQSANPTFSASDVGNAIGLSDWAITKMNRRGGRIGVIHTTKQGREHYAAPV